MKPVVQMCLCILAIFFSSGLASPFEGVCRPQIKYDEAMDTTTVKCDLHSGDEEPIRLIVQVRTSFRGKAPNDTAVFGFELGAERKQATRQAKPLFQTATQLSLRTNAEALTVPVTAYRHEYFEIIRLYAESARAEIRREDWPKLLAAQSLTGQWGSVEFNLSATEIAALKDFLSRQVLRPSAP